MIGAGTEPPTPTEPRRAVQIDASRGPLRGSRSDGTRGMSDLAPRWSWLVGILAVAAVLAPAMQSGAPDSFPLSTYPMFSRRLDQPVLDRFVGTTVDHELVLLAPRFLGSREPLQAAAIARRAATGPMVRRKELCVDVARRVAADPAMEHVTRVEVLRERWALEAFDGRHLPDPVTRARRVGCRVPR